MAKALPGLLCPRSTASLKTPGGAKHPALESPLAKVALEGIDMALSRPGEKVSIDLQHRRPEAATTSEQRLSSDAQVNLVYAEQQGHRTLHIESSRFHAAAEQVVTTHGPQALLKTSALSALVPGMQGMEHVVTSLLPNTGRASLPGPSAQSRLGPEQIALTGVARWPDERFNRESTPENQAYGQRFHATALEGGSRIASGKIQSFRQLWDFSGAARHSWATQQKKTQAGGPGQLKNGDAQPFASGYPRQNSVTTPLTGEYAYVIDKARQLPLIRQPNGLVAEHEEALPEGFMAHDVFEMVGELNGEKIPLTQLRLAVNPQDFQHPLAEKGRNGENNALVETAAYAFAILHAPFEWAQPIMNHVETLFADLVAKQHEPAELMPALGNIHWWMAHAMPDRRGSAAKTELAIRSIANAHGVELPPFARGVAADLEAFVADRESFSAGYAKLFEPAAQEGAAKAPDPRPA